MASIFTLQDVSKSFGSRRLFSGLSLVIGEGEHVGLIGPNGSGKSTLLKIMAGRETADGGALFLQKNCRCVYLPQRDELDEDATVEQTLLAALAETGVEEAEGFGRVQQALGRAGFEDPACRVATLSGGWRKRLAVVRALLLGPDLLLLDEPTNHLDLESILWLEEVLRAAPFTYVVISHDRLFLENATNRMVELNRVYPAGYLRVEGSYAAFLETRAEFLALQAREESVLANKVRREVEWLRRGPKARTTKAKSRIDGAVRLQADHAAVRDRNRQMRNVGLDFSATERKTKKLLALHGAGAARGGRTLFAGLDLQLGPGSRLGLVGGNGSGKTTLLRILAGLDVPDRGRLEQADGLKLAVFDQNRAQLDPVVTLRRALAPEGDSVVYQGRSLHVVSWAKRFLFEPQQLEMEVGHLSGGEQARILIARLMQQPVDVLFLDEPTNDLDIPSIEVLEESLLEFPGVVVLISHDRFLMDRVATQIVGLPGDGRAVALADYGQWLDLQAVVREGKKPAAPPRQEKKPVPGTKKQKKLSYKEQWELDHMEEEIEQAEAALAQCQSQLQDPAVMADPEKLAACCDLLKPAQERVERLYARWEELENLKKSLEQGA